MSLRERDLAIVEQLQQAFTTQRLLVHEKALMAAKAKGIDDLQRAQLIAASKLAGIEFTRIRGIADDKDAENLSGDLVALWRIIDPLIEAFGAYAKEHFSGIDLALFKDQLKGALDGNATFDLDEAAKSLREEQREQEADPHGWAKAARLGVD